MNLFDILGPVMVGPVVRIQQGLQESVILQECYCRMNRKQ